MSGEDTCPLSTGIVDGRDAPVGAGLPSLNYIISEGSEWRGSNHSRGTP